jgi:predicted RNA binding protein YcfA (HicA-like mRNA interferase family)
LVSSGYVVVAATTTFLSPDGRVVVIPDHGSRVVVRPLLRKIVRDIGLTVEEYNRLADSL